MSEVVWPILGALSAYGGAIVGHLIAMAWDRRKWRRLAPYAYVAPLSLRPPCSILPGRVCVCPLANPFDLAHQCTAHPEVTA